MVRVNEKRNCTINLIFCGRSKISGREEKVEILKIK